MFIQATEDQLWQIVANAVNASVPMGMGYMHYTNKEYTKEDCMRVGLNGLYGGVDYFEGRMVKLRIKTAQIENVKGFEFPDTEPRLDYQSWCRTYKTYRDLANSVKGVVVVYNVSNSGS